MNEKKVKKIRRVVGFVPAAPREYKESAAKLKLGSGRLAPAVGTREAQGARRTYQLAKRAAVKAGLA